MVGSGRCIARSPGSAPTTLANTAFGNLGSVDTADNLDDVEASASVDDSVKLRGQRLLLSRRPGYRTRGLPLRCSRVSYLGAAEANCSTYLANSLGSACAFSAFRQALVSAAFVELCTSWWHRVIAEDNCGSVDTLVN